MMKGRGFIESAVDEYVRRANLRFHTPGHKGKAESGDLTEIGKGGEIFPADCIDLAQKATAQAYGAKRIFYLVGGSSIGIKAALLAFKGKKVVCAPSPHIAFCYACELAGIDAVILGGQGGRVFTCGCDELEPPLSYGQAKAALDAHTDAAALFVTSPDYLGRTADIRIAELCGERGVKLIVDAAHGAHFAFADGLREYGFERVADVCNMSAHKTLGALTQTALLAVNDPALSGAVGRNLELLGTTSPNYLLLASLERSVIEAQAGQKAYRMIEKIRREIDKKHDTVANTDYTRVCVRPKRLTAEELYDRLYEREGITAEAIIDRAVVFILTHRDCAAELDRLCAALDRQDI